jgi:hypothetical protein
MQNKMEQQQLLNNSSCARNTAYNKESATIWNLKPEWWGSPLVQEEKYLGG